MSVPIEAVAATSPAPTSGGAVGPAGLFEVDSPEIGDTMPLGGRSAVYLGQTATGGHAFAIGGFGRSARGGRGPAVVVWRLTEDGWVKTRGPAAARRPSRPGQSWDRRG